jgi:hypothetical protein
MPDPMTLTKRLRSSYFVLNGISNVSFGATRRFVVRVLILVTTRPTFYSTCTIQRKFLGVNVRLMRLCRRAHVRRPYPNVRDKVVLIASIDPHNLTGLYVAISHEIVFSAHAACARFANTRFFRSINNQIDDVSRIVA